MSNPDYAPPNSPLAGSRSFHSRTGSFGPAAGIWSGPKDDSVMMPGSDMQADPTQPFFRGTHHGNADARPSFNGHAPHSLHCVAGLDYADSMNVEKIGPSLDIGSTSSAGPMLSVFTTGIHERHSMPLPAGFRDGNCKFRFVMWAYRMNAAFPFIDANVWMLIWVMCSSPCSQSDMAAFGTTRHTSLPDLNVKSEPATPSGQLRQSIK